MLCKKCGLEKDEKDFYKKKNGAIRFPCKACFIKYTEEWRMKYPSYWLEVNRDRMRKRRETNKGKINEYFKEHRIKNREKIREYFKEWKAKKK